MKSKVKISACIITYNQDKFISKCIENALNQKISYEYEIVIGDDCSTDNTSNICKEYAKKFPNLIKYIQLEKNLGFLKNWDNTIKECTGDFIAMCEGDDYWCYEYKLQIQIDFLIKNPNYSFCFHDNYILDDKTGELKLRIGNQSINQTVDLKSIMLEKNVSTASIVFRNNLIKFPNWYYNVNLGDYSLLYLLSTKGLGKYINLPMSVYRIHQYGIWSQNLNTNKNIITNLTFYRTILNITNNKEIVPILNKKIRRTKFELGLYKIRHNDLIIGLFETIINYNFSTNKNLKTPLILVLRSVYFRLIKSIIN